MNNTTNILLLDGSTRSYIALIGCVIQNRNISFVLVKNTQQSKHLAYRINKWLKNKQYTDLIDVENNFTPYLEKLTTMNEDHFELINGVAKSSNSTLVEINHKQVRVTSLMKAWDWNDEVLKVILNLSDFPKESKKLLQIA